MEVVIISISYKTIANAKDSTLKDVRNISVVGHQKVWRVD
jgi:hypothetical protein